MNPKIIIIGTALASIMPLSAKQMNLAEAEQIALNWMHSKYPYRDISLAPTQKQLTYNPSSSQPPAYYTISLEPKGWVIVSAESAVQAPIIGYSPTSPNHPHKQPPGFADWMRGVSQNINKLKNFLPDDAKPSKMWKMLSGGRLLMSAPLKSNGNTFKRIETPTWGQGKYYNELTPEDSRAKKYTGNDHVPTGCVATAMAEIMGYHKWPQKGKGSHTDKMSGYGSLWVDFGSHAYNWDAMPSGKLTSPNGEVAKIMYHLGVATDMQYTPAGSGTLADSIIPAFVNYFSYDVSTGVKKKENEDNWAGLIKKDIDNNLPILYAAYDDSGQGGHAFVCEGYDLDANPPYLYFNWGWDGLKNGWFHLGELNIEGTPIKFNNDNVAFLGVTPINRKPQVTSIEPSKGVAPGMGVTITGNNFYTDTNDKRYVTVSGQKVPVTQWINTMITFNAPAALGTVVIHNEAGDSEPKNFGMWVKQKVVPQHAHGLVHATVGNRVYFFGDGEASNEFSKSVEVFDRDDNNWTDLGYADTSFAGASATEHNGTIYIAGINNENDYIFDTTSNTFAKVDDNHSVPSDYGKLIKINDTLYYLGGQEDNDDTDKVYRFDGNSWVQAGHLKSNRSRFATVTVGQTVYLFGGRIDGDWNQESIEKCTVVDGNLSCGLLNATMPNGYSVFGAYTKDDNKSIVVFETDNGYSDDPLRAFIFSTESDQVTVPQSSYGIGKLLDKFSVFKHDGGFVAFGTDDNGSVVQFATNSDAGNSQSVEVPTIDENITIDDKELKMGETITIDVSEYGIDLSDDEALVIVKQPMLGEATATDGEVKYKAYSGIYSYDAKETIVLRKENKNTKARSLNAITINLKQIAPPMKSGGGGGGGGGGGCSYNPDTHSIDITMLLMLMLSLLYPFVRRRNI